MEKEIDIEYCRKNNIPILRREVGGGAVYLDGDQLFFQCVFPKERVPLRLDHLYQLFLKPAVNTYRSLGVKAIYRPVNDIQVDGKKICGSGAARIEDATVVVGNIMFDFNYGEMSRSLRVPSEKFRDKLYDSMQAYLTTLGRELGHVPDREKVKNILIKEFENILEVPLHRGTLTPDEQKMVANLDKRFTDPNWLYEKGVKLNDWVKVSSDIKVMESTWKSPGGLIRVILRLKGDTIDDILISGDFTFHPQDDLKNLENQLKGRLRNADSLLKTVEAFYVRKGIQSPGVSPGDIVKVVTDEG
jgi:lipoate-protein ligase A